MSGRHDWTVAEVNDARRWYADGMTAREIGRKLERDANSVRQKLTEIGARHDDSPYEFSPRALELAKDALRAEILAARAERDTAPLYKPQDGAW